MEWERRGGYCYYYGLCTVGGMISAGTTHLVITPLDVLKVHMQVCSLFLCCSLSKSSLFYESFICNFFFEKSNLCALFVIWLRKFLFWVVEESELMFEISNRI